MMSRTRILQLLLICLLVTALVGLFVLHGTVQPDPDHNYFPGNSEVTSGQLDTGQYVVIAGEVSAVHKNGVVIRLSGSDVRVDLGEIDGHAEVGDDVWVSGHLRETDRSANHMIETDRAIVRAPWEIGYMYAISMLAGIWVLIRFVRGWTFDTQSFGFVPKHDSERSGGDSDG